MNSPALSQSDIQGLFEPTPRGIVGLVDDLLMLCRDHQLHFDFPDSTGLQVWGF